MNSVNLEELRAADFVDSANIAVEMENMANIALARVKANEHSSANKLTPDGKCHYCGRDVDGEQLFCDEECNADYVAEQEQVSRLRGMGANIDTSRFE